MRASVLARHTVLLVLGLSFLCIGVVAGVVLRTDHGCELGVVGDPRDPNQLETLGRASLAARGIAPSDLHLRDMQFRIPDGIAQREMPSQYSSIVMLFSKESAPSEAYYVTLKPQCAGVFQIEHVRAK